VEGIITSENAELLSLTGGSITSDGRGSVCPFFPLISKEINPSQVIPSLDQMLRQFEDVLPFQYYLHPFSHPRGN